MGTLAGMGGLEAAIRSPGLRVTGSVGHSGANQRSGWLCPLRAGIQRLGDNPGLNPDIEDLYSMINGLFQDGVYKQGADG
jgi:hypothetical protein